MAGDITKPKEDFKQPQLRIERWTCDNNESEIHYFIGPQYLFGYNPGLVPAEMVERIIGFFELALKVGIKP